MATNEEKVSPEEKLLKVIQAGGPPGGQAGAESAPVAKAGAPTRSGPASPAPSAPQAAPQATAPIAAAASQPAASPAPVSRPAAAPRPAASRPAAPPAEPAAERADVKPRLKPSDDRTPTTPGGVKPTPASSRPSAKTIGAADPAPSGKRPPAVLIGASAPAVAKPRGRIRLGVGEVCRGLVGISAAMGVLSAYEIWASIQAGSGIKPPRETPSGVEAAPVPVDMSSSGYDIAEVQSAWAKRPLIAEWGGTPGPTNDPPKPPPPKEGALAYAEKNLNLMGYSGGESEKAGEKEAIIVDTKLNKMHLVKLGGTIVSGDNGETLELASMERDHVVLTDGTGKVSIR